MSRWVDFKTVRESVDFSQVLQDYGVEVTIKGNQAMGFCPLPDHKGRSKAQSKSFSVNLGKGIFQCFGCQAKGNVLDFAALMEGLDPDDTAQFRQAALMLQDRYLGEGEPQQKTSAPKKDAPVEVAVEPETDQDAALPRVVNTPMDFELKKLDSDHAYLRDRGLTRETIEYFGIGYCKQGLMSGRIAIPLHDAEGRLIGYAGRLVDDKKISADVPKYKLPGPRERDGTVYVFSKSEFLFNGFRFREPLDALIVVEGFFGAMSLHQAGRSNVVALMGASCSKHQAELLIGLVKPSGHVWVMPDGDAAGEKCAESVLATVASARFVRWIRLSDGKQPEDCSADMLESVFGWSD